MSRARALLLIPALLFVSCSLHMGGPARAPPPPHQHPQGMERGPGDILRVKELKAHTVRARVIYAKTVKAKDGSVGRVYTSDEKFPHGEGELKVDSVDADVIYAKEIKADWIEAGEIYAKEVKIGR